MKTHAPYIIRSHGNDMTWSCDLPDSSTVVLVSCVSDNIEIRGPKLKLSAPVDNGGERSADQERSIGTTLTKQLTS